MGKYRFALLVPILSLMAAVGAQAASPQAEEHLNRGQELFGVGRWNDARLEFDKARALLTTADKSEMSTVDYYLALCSAELGEHDAVARLENYLKIYSGSIHLNDVRFALASEACKRSDMEQAERYFLSLNYKALNAVQRAEYDVRMGYIEFMRGNYAEAQRYFSRVPLTSEYSDYSTYYQAYIAYSEGNYAAARRGFHALEGREPYSRLVPYYLLQIEFDEGNYRYVVDNGDALVEHAADSRRAELLRMMAEAWFHLENYPKTVEYIERAATEGGAMGRTENYILGYSLYRSARYADAVDYLRKVCGPDDQLTQNASYHLADCLLRSGDKLAAMQSFAMASNAEYDARIAEDALFNYGKLQYEMGGSAFNGAINVLTRYIAEYPDSERAAEARELLVAAYYNSHDYDAAYEAIKALPSPDGNERAALQKITYFRGLRNFKQGNYNAAKRDFAESASIGVSPKYNALAYFWQGEIAYAQRDYTTARRRYETYLERAPRNEREYALANYNIGYCRFSQGDMSEAGKSFSKFLTLYPARDNYRADALNRAGDVHYSARRFGDAVSSYAAAASIGTQAAGYARYQRAIALGAQGKTDDKIAALRTIISNRSGGDYNDDAAYELGRTYISQERFRDGVQALESFVADYPSSPLRTQALTDLGLAYKNLGNDKRSLEYYEQVISAAPNSPQARDAMQGIRDIYVSRGDVDSYFSYAERAGVEADTGEMARDSLTFASAQSFYLADKREQAEKALENYVSSFPKGYYMDDALFCLSDCYIRDNNGDRAVSTLKKLTARRRSQYTEQALDKLSSMCYDRGEYADAAEAYRALSETVGTEADRDKALEGYVRSAVRTGNDQTITAMSDYVAGKRSSGTAWRESQHALAKVYERRGDKSRANAIYATLSAWPSTVEGAEAQYRMIEAAFDAGEYDKAEKAVYAFSESDTPHSYWLAKAFLKLGDIYVVRGDSFQARATYQSVADGYSPADDGIVDEARKKIASL